MHRIKRQAKKSAWYSDDGTPNLNPFGKLWRPDSRVLGAGADVPGMPRDIEAGLSPQPPDMQRSMTDGDVANTHSADKRRLSRWEDEDIMYSQTLPPQATGHQRHSSHPGQQTMASGSKDTAIPSDSPDSSAASSDPVTYPSKEEEDTQARQLPQLNTHDGNNGGAGGIRKRRKMGGLLNKMHIGSGEEEKDGDGDAENEQDGGRKKQHFTFKSQIQHTILNSPVNILLLLVPVGIAIAYVPSIEQNQPAAVFTVNFIAIIPLAGLLSFATEELAIRVGETLGGLLNATFGNAVELIVSILALFQGQYLIVQTSLVGSMLSNLLLVMGMCFFFGGRNKVEQHFNVTVAQTAASLLALAIGALIIPTVYKSIIPLSSDTNENDGTLQSGQVETRVSEISHGTAILLLMVYGCYLFFQLSTHADMYNEKSQKAERRKPKKEKGESHRALFNSGIVGAQPFAQRDQRNSVVEPVQSTDQDDDDEQEEMKLSVTTAIITLVVSTVLVALNANYMTESIKVITATGALSEEFVGLILLPIVGNAAEHATAVTVAVKDKMDLAIGVAVGSSMQIALLVLPLVIVIGWIANHELTLAFDEFQVIVLFVAVLLVNYLIADGKSHWLEGVLLQVLYLIIAIAAWFYPVGQTVAG